MSDGMEKVRPFLSAFDISGSGYYLTVCSKPALVGDKQKICRPLRFLFSVYGVFGQVLALIVTCVGLYELICEEGGEY